MFSRKINTRAFTIIELLVVIVVIGILSLIALSAVAGAQARARNVVTVEIARSYEQALIAYLTENGSYPPPFDDPTVVVNACLGRGYDDVDGDGVGDCGRIEPISNKVDEVESINAALERYASAEMPAAKSIVRVNPGHETLGVRLRLHPNVTLEGLSNPFLLQYALEGNETDCSTSNLVQPLVTHAHTAAFNDYSLTDEGGTLCIVAMPNPNQL